MDQQSARPPDAPETPLSVTFHDSDFTNFVNEFHALNDNTLHQDSAPRHDAYSSTNEEGSRPPRTAYETPPRHLRNAPHDNTPGSSNRPHSVPSASLAPSNNNNNNQASLGTSGDDDSYFERLNNLDFTSLDMSQLLESDETLNSTQNKRPDSARMMLSQEFAEARIGDSDSQKDNTAACGAKAAIGARAMSAPGPTASTLVPATPTTGGQPISASSVDSFGRTDMSAVPGQQQQQPQLSGTAHHHQANVAGRGKANLYPRLAQHIPPRPDSSSYSSQRPPQIGQHGRPVAVANDSPIHGAVSRQHQQHQQRFKPYAPSFSGPGGQTGTNSSTLVPATNKLKPPHASAQSTVTEISAMHAEQAQLKADYERKRAEAEQLREQLYTKEGEVKIVRENLARTEMENTHLQEQLSNQQTGATARLEQRMKELLAENERLNTELVFNKHEAKVEAMAKVQSVRVASTPRPVVVASRSGLDVRGVGVNGTQRSGTGSPITYPSVEDFMSVPRTLPKPAVTDTQTLTQNAHPLSSVASKLSDKSTGSGDSRAHTDTSTMALLDILSGIAELPNAASFGSLVSLSAQLSRAVRDPESKQLHSFHLMACETLTSSASKSGGFEQLGATAQLLLQVINSLSEFRSTWLFCSAEPSSSSDAGLRCTSQLSCAAGTALLESIYAAAKMRTNSSESVVCSAAIASLCQLLIRIIGLQPVAALGSEMWAGFNPCELGQYFTSGLGLSGLLGVVGLLTTLIQVSPMVWGYLRGSPGDFERLLLAIMRRLQVAFLANDVLTLDGKRAFLVLIASAIVTHEDDTPVLINSMRRFTTGMVQWFLEEHLSLTRTKRLVVDCERRVQVFFEYIKCLNVVLSEVKDVVTLLGGDNSPLFFGFVAACTRMTLGEGVFDGVASIRELAADLLAYVVTEDQAVSIQSIHTYSASSGNPEHMAATAASPRPGYGLSAGTRRRSTAVFDDRIHAGSQLANNLREYVGDPNVVVLSVSRGGAVVGSVVASELGRGVAHLYYVVRPIPFSGMPRLSLGSVAGDGSVRIDNAVARSVGVSDGALLRSIEAVDVELSREQAAFYGAVPTAERLEGRTLVIVDDGMEAGDTMREAVMHLRHCYRASKVVVAVPVCLADLRKQLLRHVDGVVDIVSPVFVGSVARWYALGVAVSAAEQQALNYMFVNGGSGSFDFD
ncbi:hypothetical protein GGH94_004912 [Coemansia aciculifera]|uniref:Phosphoribosyltransferase domain-containing protein n=1 Tax=Coemansia aciculifera TaxID=417176 RepID=A0A9W8M4C9_9FUNG|nr:hypothetical protein GGH94_004912 [Coemansia aciculifera]